MGCIDDKVGIVKSAKTNGFRINDWRSRLIKTAALFAGLVIGPGCAQQATIPQSSSITESIDAYVSELVELNQVPGLAIGVIRNGKVIFEKYYGVMALDSQQKVTDKTVFRIYSLSKLMAATAVFGLIEQGRIQLETPLTDFLDDLPQQWRAITVGHLLAHASGLPDIRDLMPALADENLSDKAFIRLLYDKPMQFSTGEAWSYNQSNYLLLEYIIEQLTERSFEDYLLSSQFGVIKRRRGIFSSSDLEAIPNRAAVYSYDVEADAYQQKLENYGPRNNILAGLNLTLNELIQWSMRFDQGAFLNAQTKKRMWTPFDFGQSEHQFSYGWGVYPVADQTSFGFTGGGVSGLRKFLDHDMTIIVLSNGYKYYSVHNTVINHVAGIVDPALENKPVALARSYQHDHLKHARLDVDELYQNTVQQYPELSAAEVFESFGYKLLDIGASEQAIAVFKKVVQMQPESFSAAVNLGFALLSQGQMQQALVAFEKALMLRPGDAGTEKIIKGIRERL